MFLLAPPDPPGSLHRTPENVRAYYAAHIERVETPGRMLRPFSALASDGRRYDLRSLTAAGPVLLVDLARRGPPIGIAGLNRLERMMRGRVRVVGLVMGGPRDMRIAARRYGIRFLLLQDDYEMSYDLRDHKSSTGYLSNGLVLRTGRITRVWNGYNRWTISRMREDARRYAGVRVPLDLSQIPKALQVGSGVLWNMSGGPD